MHSVWAVRRQLESEVVPVEMGLQWVLSEQPASSAQTLSEMSASSGSMKLLQSEGCTGTALSAGAGGDGTATGDGLPAGEGCACC